MPQSSSHVTMRIKARILVTGVGGSGGFNFVSALRTAERAGAAELFIVGTDYNRYHILAPDVNVRHRTPRHSDPEFIPTLLTLAKQHTIEFIHPHPSSEAKVVSEMRKRFEEEGVSLYLPDASAIAPSKDYIIKRLNDNGVPVPSTKIVKEPEDVENAFRELGGPLWIRARAGAGGRLGLKVNTPEEAILWIRLNVLQGRATWSDFLLHTYLPGRDFAFDSLWYRGKLITSYARERLEYPLRHISLSGITGTPSVARTIRHEEINRVGIAAVLALDPSPHGFYSVDLKEGADGKIYVTEVDGKWHTTAPLWGEAISLAYSDQTMNLALLYLHLGITGALDIDVPKYDLYPEGLYLIRQLDTGVILYRESDGKTWRIR